MRVRPNIDTTSRVALPESHTPISSIKIAASTFSALLTSSGSNALMLVITFWTLSSSMLYLATRQTQRKRAAAMDAPGDRDCSHRNHKRLRAACRPPLCRNTPAKVRSRGIFFARETDGRVSLAFPGGAHDEVVFPDLGARNVQILVGVELMQHGMCRRPSRRTV